jgi:hypothetical protein
MKLSVSTHAFGEIFYTPYVRSLLRLQRALIARKDEMTHSVISYAEVSEGRNLLLTNWYDKSDASHILFVDSDMGFEADLILRMIALKKLIVGVVSTRRQIDLKRVTSAAAQGEPSARAIAKGHDFILRPVQGREPKRIKGFQEFAAVGAGILLIERDCATQMLKKLPMIVDKDAKRTSPLAKDLDRLIRAFDPIATADGRLSEDFAFCHRWHKLCGGEIWANTDSAVTHIGLHRYGAAYANVSRPRVQIIMPDKPRVTPGAMASVRESKGPKSTKGRLAIPPKLAAKAKPKTKH